MEYFCHFHPTSAARWRCTQCNRHYDHACAISVSDKKTPPCPVCRASLSPLHSDTHTNSELSLLSDFLLTSSFILMLCSMILLAAVSALAPIPSAIMILLNVFVVVFISLHYGRQTVFSKVVTFDTRTASKRTTRARRIQGSSLPGIQDSLKSAIPFTIVYLFPVFIFYQVQWLAGLILMLVAVCLVPYMLFFMLSQLNTQHPLAPKKILAFVHTYKNRLILLSLILYFSCLMMTDFAFIHTSRSIAMMLGSAAVTISVLILLYQHTQLYSTLIRELETLPAEGKTIQSLTRDSKQGEPANKTSNMPADKYPQLSTEIELALKTGHYAHAVSLLEHALKQNPHSVLRRQQLYLLLSEINDLEKLSHHAELFLNWMLDRGKVREASQFLYRLRKHDPTFMLNNMSLKAELAKQFTRQKKYALVLWLAESCRKHLAPGEELAAIYLSASQVLITHYQDLAKAEEYLLFSIKHCAACESAEAAKALLIHVQNNQLREQQLRK